jgi:Uma2 family endonuclease
VVLLDAPPWPAPYLTVYEFLALPEIKPYLEYDRGIVRQKCSANADHGALQVEIASRINKIGRGRRLGLGFIEARFVTPTWAPTPDVAYYRKERIRPVSDDRIGELYVAPDIAVEIVSPGEHVERLFEKCTRYVALGGTVGLVVDPEGETVYDIRPSEPLRVLRGDDPIDLEPVLPDFSMTVRALFDSMVDDWLLEPDPAEQLASE